MQTLRKKTSPCKYKNEPSRFLGEGVSFKAKLIGILEVNEARGDRMCQEALADLKMAIRAAGEHKQRININIAIDGLRLRDEKTGDSLYHHPVHKISFIAQDMSDSRAFGYIFGSPDTGHRFFGIKTDKAASQVVIAMRDLFQVVFELKKKEIEVAKQHIEQKSRFGTNTSSLFSDTAVSSTKSYQNGDTTILNKMSSITESTTSKSGNVPEASARAGGTSEAIADLVDLELELSSIQQGIHQMERITPSDPFGPNKDDPFNSDPFGDSFTSFPQKPFLPPPPASTRERHPRTASDTSSLFSPKTPKTPKTGGSADASSQEVNLFKTSHDEPSSCDWFTPTSADNLFEDPLVASELPTKESESSTRESNASILSQFDVFTELDPLGTGRSKPYVDKKLFFQELKNPPKKVLKDLVTETQPSDTSLFNANFDSNAHTSFSSNQSSLFQTDPFAEGDPFDKSDPFAEADFNKTIDPFDTDFVEDFKMFNKQDSKNNGRTSIESIEEPDKHKIEKLQPLFPSPLSKSPNRLGMFDKQMSMSANVSPRTSSTFIKQNTYEDKKSMSKLTQLHENPSLDMSSESECVPEPPPRPATNITPIKPPPLPPKKQPGDIALKPPPRPPHTEESHYDYMDTYETAPNSLESFENFEQTPPLPVPARKSRFDTSDFLTAPQRPKKQFQGQSSEEDYLTPVAPPTLPPQKKDTLFKLSPKNAGPILLPPPVKKDSKRSHATQNQVPVVPLLETKPQITNSDKYNVTPDTLDITLSQLTMSGLNELASKLNIPASQLSNMTLVQLTNFLSNYFKSGSHASPEKTDGDTFPTFKADFSANFNDLNISSSKAEPYDRYAVFRELLQQEDMKQGNDSNPDETIKIENSTVNITKDEDEVVENVEFKPTFQETNTMDRYAALREIIIEDKEEEQKESNLEATIEEEDEVMNDIEKEQNNLNVESVRNDIETSDKLNCEVESNIIEYTTTIEITKDKIKAATPTKSPTSKQENILQSPVPLAITEVIQTNNHLNSGSLSDVVSGSSPEVDNVTTDTKNEDNTARESWAIFDKPNIQEEVKEKQVQSEEGVSPWSSDSKEFGNGSPCEWPHRRDSGSEGDWIRRRKEREPGWWDKESGTEGHHDKHRPYTRERRSTDSYDDDWYKPDRPRRRTRQPMWNKGQGGQSSSSRDVSPWEEEEPRIRRGEEFWPGRRRGPSWERDRHRRRDSWEEEEDYDYEEGYISKFHWPERHGSRDSERVLRESERHGIQRDDSRGHWENLGDQWSEDRKPPNRRRGHPSEERWFRPDWDHENEPVCGTKEKSGRYSGARWTNPESKWRGDRDRKREPDRYFKHEHSQESPWEDEYSNDPDEPHSPRYMSSRRNWKRPASASETDRKTGEIKPRQQYFIGTGGSDGERDRRYKSNRRSRSKDSQFSEMSQHRHKPDPGLTLRYSHRNREKYLQKFENEFSSQEGMPKSKVDVKADIKKSLTLGRKKTKDSPSPKTENDTILTKSSRKQEMMFENDFVNSENDSPIGPKTKFNFENDFETSEAESPVTRHKIRQQSFEIENCGQLKRSLKSRIGFENDFSKEERSSRIRGEHHKQDVRMKNVSPTVQMTAKQKSLFEDDFSPTDKFNDHNEDNGITVIAEETVAEPKVSFSENNLDRTVSEPRKARNILARSRMSSNIRGDVNLKKSESVNIFARENDPFDDDFFSGRDAVEIQRVETSKSSPLNVVTEFQWTEDFDSFEIPEEKK